MPQESFLSSAVQQSNEPDGTLLVLQLAYVPFRVNDPVGDRVISLVMETGRQIEAQVLLLILLPSSSALRGTQAYALIQQDTLRFVSFFGQCFRTYQAEVVKNSQVMVLQNEIEMLLSILEPVYRLKVSLVPCISALTTKPYRGSPLCC